MLFRPDIVIDNETMNLVTEIAVLIDRIPKGTPSSGLLELRRNGRIRTIHSTAAIEGNKLSLNNVTDIINGKQVAGDPKDILEIKNAQKAYDRINRYDPFSLKDLLNAHGAMMSGLEEISGEFRDCEVGVFKGPVVIHIPPEYDDVPMLMNDLLEWGKGSDLHPLIMSCAFHSRFEYIHPFVDGNGRMGRLWHSLILSKWNPAFGYLPIESWVNMNKKEYYNSLRGADDGNIAVFIKFMLTMIRMAVDEFVDEITYMPKKKQDVKKLILNAISKDPKATAVFMAETLNVSISTIKRHLSSMSAAGKIKRVGSDKTGHWEITLR
jgi:Fic family protein